MSQQTQFQTDLINFLADLVPGTIRAEFHAERIPDDAELPVGSLSIVRRDDIQQVGNTTSGLEFTEVELETFASTPFEAVSYMDEAWAVLQNFKGLMGSSIIEKVSKTSDLDGYEDASESYFRSVQLTFGHR